MNFYNDKTRRKIAAAIVVILVIAMVLPLLVYALYSGGGEGLR